MFTRFCTLLVFWATHSAVKRQGCVKKRTPSLDRESAGDPSRVDIVRFALYSGGRVSQVISDRGGQHGEGYISVDPIVLRSLPTFFPLGLKARESVGLARQNK